MMRYASAALVLAVLALCSCEGPAGDTQLVVDSELCVGCGRCEEVCPYGAVEVVEGDAVIDPALCHLCLRCVEECPKGAIY